LDGLGDVSSSRYECNGISTAVTLFGVAWTVAAEFGANKCRKGRQNAVNGYELSYNTKNDKAFAVSGKITHTLMDCPELTKPRIQKSEIKNIILDGGQNLLSPERRFDAIIFNSPELFD
jgi:hypothetical protein